MTDKNFKSRISLSVVTMIACCAVFCTTTFAWFTSRQSSTVSPIVSAEYLMKVSIDGQALDNNEYTCPLATKDCHVFTIAASGTATTGYCQITADDQVYPTVSIPKGQSITLNIFAKEETQISFSAYWGTHSERQVCYRDGDSIQVSHTPYQLYTVAENVTLEQIAQHYQVPADDILLYNGISELTVGVEICIPNTNVTEPLTISEESAAEAEEPADDPVQEPAENETTPAELPEKEVVDTESSESSETVKSTDAETEESPQTEHEENTMSRIHLTKED